MATDTNRKPARSARFRVELTRWEIHRLYELITQGSQDDRDRELFLKLDRMKERVDESG